MQSIVERMSRRVKEHPIAVVASFLATVALPLITIAFSLAPPFYAFILSVLLLVSLGVFLALEPDQDSTEYRDHTKNSNAQTSDKPSDEYMRSVVRKYMLHNFGSRARLSHYHKHANAANASDTLYREVIESLLDDANWSHIANAAQEWVAIGFETLVNSSSGWNNSGTKNQLYRAVTDCLLSQELNIRDGIEFGEHITMLVSSKRLIGG